MLIFVSEALFYLLLVNLGMSIGTPHLVNIHISVTGNYQFDLLKCFFFFPFFFLNIPDLCS